MTQGVLGIDGHRLGGARTGVGRYVAELLREWADLESPFSEIVVFAPDGVERDLVPAPPFRVRTLPGAGGSAFHWTLGRAARDVDLLFCPSYAAPLAYRGPFVVTVHDALSALMPPERGVRPRLRHLMTQRSARSARRVVTVSETSRRDIARCYGVPTERIVVVPNGCRREFFLAPEPSDVDDVRGRFGLEGERFCLYVGKLARRRNLAALLEAFAAARKRSGSPHLLVLVGQNTLDQPVAAAAEAAGIGDQVRLTGHIPDTDLHVLYHEAELFVYPSSYEGFGLPVLEAMAAGTPVLTARNSALEEVAGDAALLVDEPRVDLLAGALAELMSDDALRQRLSERGRQRAGLFPWSRTAAETMAVLAAVASASR